MHFQLKKQIQFLVIEGNIGAGKTTLAEKLSDEFNAKLIQGTICR